MKNKLDLEDIVIPCEQCSNYENCFANRDASSWENYRLQERIAELFAYGQDCFFVK